MDENDKSNYNLRILITYGDIIRSMHIPDQSGPGFPTSYVVLFFYVQSFEVRGDYSFY